MKMRIQLFGIEQVFHLTKFFFQFLGFGIHKIDGYRDRAFGAQGEDTCFQPARLLVDVQDVFRDICPSNKQVYLALL